ncbi:MAG: amidohydrolase family protein [Acidimicrobiia bacterium]
MANARDEIVKVFDADNHYWEASDAFTKFRDREFLERGVEVREVDGVLRYVVDGQVFQGLPGPGDVHPRPLPGSFMDYFSGKLSRAEFLASFNVAPADHPEWYDRDARLAVMDEQGVEATWLFPSQGVVLEPSMHKDLEVTIEVYRAFNRWVEDQWGFAYQDRIFGVPYLITSDPDQMVGELQWCLDHGARVVAIRHGAAVTPEGNRSPADPMFDGFWGLAQEAGVVVTSHDGADTTYSELGPLLSRVWGDGVNLGAHAEMGDNMRMHGGGSVMASLLKNRIVHDFSYILVAHRLFERFPRLKVAYIEHGCAWVPSVLQALEYLGHGGEYEKNPKDEFIEHCWVAPFVEESVDELARHLPVERILFGSDWPHGEGFPEPKDFFDNVTNFSLVDQRRIMYENARELTFS